MNDPGLQILPRPRAAVRGAAGLTRRSALKRRLVGGLALPLLLLTGIGTGPALHAPPGPDGLTLRYVLQEVDVDRARREQLRSYLTESSSSYLLVQGFACDTGGYDVSVRVARQRGAAITGELATLLKQQEPNAGQGPDRVRAADPAVLHGAGREAYRRSEVRRFRSAAERDRALVAANRAAARWNAAALEFLNSAAAEANRNTEDARGQSSGAATHVDVPGTQPQSRRELFFLLGLLLLLLVVGLIWLYAGRREDPAKHRLNPDEAEALEILTGGAVTPVPAPDEGEAPVARTETKSRRRSGKESSAAESEAATVSPLATGGGAIHEFIDRARNQNMGVKKKSKSKITPISIRGAVDRDFEEKSLGELSRAPIHALEGLTPRHARMMEEAFGVKTVEDLARLKYVEIARAIVVLSRFEK